MKYNTKHPQFTAFIDKINYEILNSINVINYFTINDDNKLGNQYMLLKIIKNSVTIRSKLTDNDYKYFLSILKKKNEETENYELAALMNDTINNFENVCNYVKPIRRNKPIKLDKKQNEE